MPPEQEERTEEPTPKRLSDARKKGDVAKSQEVVSSAVFLASICYFHIFLLFHLNQFEKLFSDYLSFDRWLTLDLKNIFEFTFKILLKSSIICAPFLFVTMVAAVVASVSQVGFLISFERLTPNFIKVNPFQNLDKIFRKESLFEGLKSTAKLFTLFYFLYLINKKEFNQILTMNFFSLREQINFAFHLCLKMGYWTVFFMIILSGIDYGIQRRFYMKRMRMTRHELREELKEQEGDPLMKGRIRSIQMNIARKRMMAEVPKSDVVVVNPTDYAVALKYDKEIHKAPVVVAKGIRLIALKIKKIAKENKIPIIEDPPLARILYKSCKLGQEIPVALYKAIAEILAYIYRLTKKKF